MTCPELRITEAETADCPRRDVRCPHCAGKGLCYHGGDDVSYPDPDWCCDCGGAGSWSAPCLPPGASARIGAILVEALLRTGGQV